jgi:hypothetical protein
VAVPPQEYASGYQGARAASIGINRADGKSVRGVRHRAERGRDRLRRHPCPSLDAEHVGRLRRRAATDAGITDAVPAGSSQMAPRVAVGPDGAPHAAWVVDNGAGTRRIMVRRFSSAAGAWRARSAPRRRAATSSWAGGRSSCA